MSGDGVKTLTADEEVEVGKPLDFSFKQIETLDGVLEGPRSTRVGAIPERGAVSRRYLTRALWLNNNRLISIKNIENVVANVLDQPEKLAWLDFSYNQLTEIDEVISEFTNLVILYFHSNSLNDVDDIFKLRDLKALRTVTFHGNPITGVNNYRSYVTAYLPQVRNLDFSPITKEEMLRSYPSQAVKKLAEYEALKRKNRQ